MSTRTEVPAVEGRSRRTWVLVITSIASLMVVLDALVVATALTAIRTDLGASITGLEWTANGQRPARHGRLPPRRLR